jgi:hypothetical protein
MERYIGMDVHAASCTLAVISEKGRKLKDFPVETNGQALVGAIRMIPGHKHLGIGHTSCVLAQRPSTGLMSIPYGEPATGLAGLGRPDRPADDVSAGFTLSAVGYGESLRAPRYSAGFQAGRSPCGRWVQVQGL